jgi:hypothetical protein
MLRSVVAVLAVLVVIGGAVATLTVGPAGIGWLVMGVLVLIGLLAERVYYKRIVDRAPDPRFERTSERFRDPVTGAVVDVYADPKTGERAYVRAP